VKITSQIALRDGRVASDNDDAGISRQIEDTTMEASEV
jgi:hypothetical protein